MVADSTGDLDDQVRSYHDVLEGCLTASFLSIKDE